MWALFCHGERDLLPVKCWLRPVWPRAPACSGRSPASTFRTVPVGILASVEEVYTEASKPLTTAFPTTVWAVDMNRESIS